MEKVVDPSIVSVSIYVIINNRVTFIEKNDLQLCSHAEELTSLKLALMKEIKEVTGEYLFYNAIPFFETVSLKSTNRITEGQLYYYLTAEIDVGDCIEDEWMITKALYTVSKNHSDWIVFIRFVISYSFTSKMVMVTFC